MNHVRHVMPEVMLRCPRGKPELEMKFIFNYLELPKFYTGNKENNILKKQ